MDRKNIALKRIAAFLAVLVLNQAIWPTVALCLTSGPSQPEFSGFAQAGVTDMVDIFSGDFTYNLPLGDVDGFPLNISYSSNPRMDDEASWVGLGWSLNPGSISRSLRGIPDDFTGETITKKSSMAPDQTVGVDGSVNLEIIGLDKGFGLSVGVGGALSYNTRRGFDFTTSLSFNPVLKIGDSNSAINANVGLSSSSANGLNMNVGVGLGKVEEKSYKSNMNVSAGLNSRQGLKSLTFQKSLSTDNKFLNGLIGASGIGSVTHNFGPFSYTPTAALPIINSAFSFSGKAGGEAFGLHPNFTVGGFYSEQKLAYKTEQQISYGYMHLEDGQDNENAVLDYNSETSGQIKENTPNLPLAYGTYDVFAVAGQGVGGTFRAVRNDIGLMRPAKQKNMSTSGSIGGELGGGNAVHGGIDVFLSTSNSDKTAWVDPGSTLDYNLRFRESSPDYRNFAFKFSNDNSNFQNNVYKGYGKDDALFLNHYVSGSALIPDAKWRTDNNSYQLTGEVKNTEETPLNKGVKYLTAAEASKVGLTKSIENYPDPALGPVYGDCNFQPDPIDRLDRTPANQLSEFTVVSNEGSRYVYGLPVKNVTQESATFSVVNTGEDEQNLPDFGLVDYDLDENSANNDSRREKYYEANIMPAYNHSFLLTGMLSADYVDKTGDGITDDDLGDAVKINYHKHPTDFKWRIPVEAGKAQFHKGYNSDDDDNKGSIVYGEKELWYVHSIESRTKVAQFYTLDRADGHGVNDINGGAVSSQKVKLLDKISIFSKSELIQNPTNPVPLKTIHFNYDYSLCPGVPNNLDNTTEGGKLTLKSIHFTYQNSDRGVLSPYIFNYKAGPSYAMGLYNRWGFPQENPGTYPNVQDYPYVIQGQGEQATQNAGAWSLNSITLPTGAVTTIEYEPDDYAYVQNKRAGQMMEVVGFTNDVSGALNNVDDEIYTGPKESEQKKYVVVKVEDFVPGSLSETEWKKRYFEDVGEIYFDMLVNLTNNGHPERVKGYFSIDPSLDVIAVDSRFLIPIKFLKDSKRRKVNPIAFAGMQILRLQLPEIIHPEMNTLNPGVAFFKSIFNVGKEIRKLFRGFEYLAMKKKWAKTIEAGNHASWVRLANPTFKKLAAGSRVKRISISDNWNFGGATPSSYGQSYEYTTEKEIGGVKQTISSGVASYEPASGGEENLMRQPLNYEEKHLLGPKNYFYSETPVGESLFPSPSIGYSKVKMVNIANENPELIRTRSGYSIYEFFTAKDFPTKVAMTQILPNRVTSDPIIKFLKIQNKDIVSMAQGFSVELNDMHGKSKSEKVYDKNEQLLSSTTYNYQEEVGSGETKSLNNTVDLIAENGVVEKDAQIGMEFDLWQETFKEETVTEGNGTKISGDFFMAFIVPILLPTAFPNINRETIGLSAAVTTKVIHRNGILNNIEVMQDGSKIVTENIAYDAKTGNVLINKTQNEHDDPVYSFTTPAYWAYPYMAHAADNLNRIIPNVVIGQGYISDTEAQGLIRPGDELLVIKNGVIEDERAYAVKAELETDFTLLKRNGDIYTSAEPVDLKVIRSGNRNMLGGSIQQTQTLADPIASDQIPFDGVNDQVLSSSVSTYKSDFPIECEVAQDPIVRRTLKPKNNPYVSGGLGQWRPYQTFTPKNLRGTNGAFTALASTDNQGVYGKYDGTLTDYFSGWVYDNNQSKWVCQLDTWILGEEITKYDKNGNALESLNALCIPTAAHFGYKNSLPTIIASNSKYAELYNEGFEEYTFEENCDESDYRKHLEIFTQQNVKITQANLSDDFAHTGLHSLEIPSGQTYSTGAAFFPCAKPASQGGGGLPAAQGEGSDRSMVNNDEQENVELRKDIGIASTSSTTNNANPEMEVAQNSRMDTPYTRWCGTSEEERYLDMAAHPDGGYLAVGYADIPASTNSLGRQVLVSRIDVDGNAVWTKTYGNVSEDAGNSIIRTIDGHYAFTGYSNSQDANSNDVILVKINDAGGILWQRSYLGSIANGYKPTMFAKLIQLANGDYVIASRTNQNATNNQLDSYVIKVRANGTHHWSRTFNQEVLGDDNDAATDVIETNDDQILMMNFFNTASDRHDIGLIKLDTLDGSVIWGRGFGTGANRENSGSNVIQLANSDFVVAGFAATEGSYTPTISNALLLRVNSNGIREDATGYYFGGTGRYQRFINLIENSPNQIITTGWNGATINSNDLNSFIYDFGSINQSIGDEHINRVFGFLENPDNTYSLAGEHKQGNNNRDAYIVKTDQNGEIPGICPTTTLGRVATTNYNNFNTYPLTDLTSSIMTNSGSLNLSETVYTLLCDESCNCPTIPPTFTYQPNPVCEDSLVLFTSTTPGVSTYQWYINGNPWSTAESFSYAFPNEGTYTVTLEHPVAGCDPIWTEITISVYGGDPIGEESITIKEECTDCLPHQARQIFSNDNSGASPPEPRGYYPTCAGCLPLFTPEAGKDYLISGWVASSTSIATNEPHTINDLSIQVGLGNGSVDINNVTLIPEGPIIDGWQRISGKITVPETLGNINTFIVRFINQELQTAYFDDLRIHPNICNAKSYVYDSYSSRLMAELDENNYALFYEYDDEGLLVRMKRETERGIVTLQEGRTVTKPNPYQ